MIYVTQLIYIKTGQEQIFDAFEAAVTPLIAKHDGDLILRARLPDGSLIDGSARKPYEIHLVSFPSAAHLQSFMQDDERREFLELKDQSVESSILIQGERL